MIFSFLKTKKVGLALGGGAARGYAHIPIIQELIKGGITPKAVSGCSAGALIGAYYCLHGEVDTFIDKIHNMKRRDFIALIDINNPMRSIIKGRKIKEFFIKEFFKDATFDDLKIPLTVVATDLQTLKTVEINSGKLIDAVMASIAMPGIFPPREVDGHICIDGGVSNHLPYKILFTKYKMKKIIAVDLMGGVRRRHVELHPKDYNIFDVLFASSYGILRNVKIESKYIDKVITLSPMFSQDKTGSAIAFNRISENLTPGEKCINKNIKNITEWIL